MRGTILLVDDDPDFAGDLAAALESSGHTVVRAGSLSEAEQRFDERRPDLVLLDLQLPDGHGLQLLEVLRSKHREASVIVLSGYATVEMAVEAIKLGAVDFVEKPVRFARLEAIVTRALRSRALERKVARLRQDVVNLQGTDDILGTSDAIRETKETIRKLGLASDTTVLISGESGTGKELVARGIHDASPRRDGPFVAVNCAALTETLLESELFGYAPGAFTGGSPQGKEGLFEAADGGTLFLDEISELELPLQAKLLRALQERIVRRVGSVRDVRIDIRVIASTNRDLPEEVSRGSFRADLYYRLSVAPISLPPLRERGDDVLLLADHYLRHFCRQMARSTPRLTSMVADALMAHRWPGNVRELRNLMEHAAILCQSDELGVAHLSLRTSAGGAAAAGARSAEDLARALPDRKLATLERAAIRVTLEEQEGNVAAAARQLGIHRQTLYNKLKAYGLR